MGAMTLEILEMPLRHARRADLPRLDALIAASARGLCAAQYSPEQIESALGSLFALDEHLIDDRTFYLVDGGDGLAACGGWSKRTARAGVITDPRVTPAELRGFFVHPDLARRGLGRRIFMACRNAAEAAGFKQFEASATLTAEPFLTCLGFQRHERAEHVLAGGVTVPMIRMTRRVS